MPHMYRSFKVCWKNYQTLICSARNLECAFIENEIETILHNSILMDIIIHFRWDTWLILHSFYVNNYVLKHIELYPMIKQKNMLLHFHEHNLISNFYILSTAFIIGRFFFMAPVIKKSIFKIKVLLLCISSKK